MIRSFQYRTSGVCAKVITVTVDDDRIVEVSFYGGCMGNSQGVASLAKGMTIDEVISRLSGIDCGGKGTSCPDQLARALRMYKAKMAQSKIQD